jgi:hypothetical protein
MTPEQTLKAAIDYQIEVAKWVKEVFKWHKEQGEANTQGFEGPGTNPTTKPPPPPPAG